jgi:hypothetical protein
MACGAWVYPVVFMPIGDGAIGIAAVIRQGRDIPLILQKDGFEIRRDLQEIRERTERGLIVPSNKRDGMGDTG